MAEAHWEIWVVEGTAGLILTMAGLAYFGSAVRYLVHIDRINEYVDRKALSRAARAQPNRVANRQAKTSVEAGSHGGE